MTTTPIPEISVQPTPACGEYDPNALTWTAARARILDALSPLNTIETVSLVNQPTAALNRVLAEDIHSLYNVPNHTNSAMDGFAFRASDLEHSGQQRLQLAGEAFAGTPFSGEIKAGECIRIMTGAVMPKGADTVVMQEHTMLKGNTLYIDKAVTLGANVRHAGEDLKNGDRVLPSGHRVRPSDLGLIASVGHDKVRVIKRPTVAFFSNGDELKPLGTPLREGELHDSNRYSLAGLLAKLDVEAIDLGIIPDDYEALKATFLQADAKADVVITSAGASVGEADFIHRLLTELGEVNFWKVAIKPGRPLAFGKLPGSWFFGLPGNPVSVMVTFAVFALPALRKLAGEQAPPLPIMCQATTESPLRKRPGRAEFQRAVARNTDSGQLVVTTTGDQGSGILSSMRDGNCFIVLDTDTANVSPGESVDIIFFNELYA